MASSAWFVCAPHYMLETFGLLVFLGHDTKACTIVQATMILSSGGNRSYKVHMIFMIAPYLYPAPVPVFCPTYAFVGFSTFRHSEALLSELF